MWESIGKFWEETMEIPEARWIVWLTTLVILILVAIYVVMYFRGQATGRGIETTDYLSEFEKLKEQGELDDEEFSRLKSVIPRHIPLLDQSERKGEVGRKGSPPPAESSGDDSPD